MKQSEKGFSLIELIIATTIITLVSGAAGIALFQVFKGTERNSNHMTAVRQVQNAGYWISHDTHMAQGIMTDNLTSPHFLILSWTEESSSDNYQVTYTLEDMPEDKLKKLQRNLYINGTGNTTTFVAQHIDPNTEKTKCEFASGKLTLTVTATAGDGPKAGSETRIYEVVPRPG